MEFSDIMKGFKNYLSYTFYFSTVFKTTEIFYIGCVVQW